MKSLAIAVTIFAASFFYFNPVFSQVKDNNRADRSNAIQHFDSLMTFKVNVSNDIEALSVTSGSNEIILQPNAQLATRFNFSYKYLSFGFNVAPAFLQEKDNKAMKGSSKLRSIGLNLNQKHWQQSAFYSRTKGYYLENTSDYDPSWRKGKPYIQFPDLVFRQFYGSTAYSFNARFSPNAVITQTERQLLSAGSFIPVLSYRYSISDDRTAIVPGTQTQKARNFELLLGPGYYYTWVHNRKFYFSGGLTISGGIVFSTIESRSVSGSTKAHQRDGMVRVDGALGMGYNGDRFFGGIYGRAIGSRFQQAHTSVVNIDDRVIGHITIGYRLQAPVVLKKIMRLSDQKIEQLKEKAQQLR